MPYGRDDPLLAGLREIIRDWALVFGAFFIVVCVTATVVQCEMRRRGSASSTSSSPASLSIWSTMYALAMV